MNRFISIKLIEPILNKLPKQKTQGPDGFTGEFYQRLKEEILPIFYHRFQKIEAEGILPNSFYEVNITITSKPDKDFVRKENYRPISLINKDAKILKIY